MKFLRVCIAFFPLAIFSCDQGTVPSTSLGRFNYIAYDSLGVPVARGWLLLSGDDSLSVSGRWHIDPVGAPVNIGPQLGDGTLVGFFDNDQFFVELNPEYRDNNVGLFGAFDGTMYEGSWTFSGFPGVINTGTFTAVRRKD